VSKVQRDTFETLIRGEIKMNLNKSLALVFMLVFGLFIMTACGSTEEVVVQWPTELDGITPLQGFNPNQATMNDEGLVTVDYSDVTDEALDSYREALIADGFELTDVGTGVEAYARIDEEGTTFLVVVNPQDDVEGHLQLSGIISPAE